MVDTVFYVHTYCAALFSYFIDEYFQVARRDKDSFSFLKLQLLIAFFRQVNLNQVAGVSSGKFEMNKRTNGMDMIYNSRDGRGAVEVAGHFNIMRAYVAYSRHVVSIGMLWRLKLNVANPGPSLVNASMKAIHVAEEMHDEIRRGMVEHVVG